MTLPSRSEVEQTLASFEGATPGDWFIVNGNKVGEVDSVRSKAFTASNAMGDYQGVVVANLRCCHGGRQHAYDEAAANARLIAAAPQLVEWVRELSAENAQLLKESVELTAKTVNLLEIMTYRGEEMDILNKQLNALKEELEEWKVAHPHYLPRGKWRDKPCSK